MPDWSAEIRRRLAPLRLAPTREAEIVEELAQHLEDRYDELRLQGVPEDEARRVALAELSKPEGIGGALAGVERPAPADPPAPGLEPRGGGGWFRHLGQDLRYGLRMLRARPAFTAVVVATLALGMGANTAIFSVVRSVLLRPLPYPESDRLVTFWGTAPEKRLPVVAFPDALFVFYHDQAKSMEHVAAWSGGGVTVTGVGEPERINAPAVSLDFFTVMRIPPLRGRAFSADEMKPGGPAVAVVSYGLWQRRYGGDPELVGKVITLGRVQSVVVGIMPRGFDFPDRAEAWVPLRLEPEGLDSWYLDAVGRLKPGLTARDVSREIAGLTDEFMLRRPARFPDAKRGGARIVAKPLLEASVGDTKTPLLVLMGAVGLVLLIATANIANLLLARGTARAREMTLRCCLGANPRRIAGQLFTESLLLAAAGAAVGLGLAFFGIGVVRTLSLQQIPRLDEVHLDAPVLLFSLGVTLFTGILFGLIPALRASRVDLLDALREGGGARSGTTAGSHRLTQGFVVAQFALSLVLLVGAGLLLRSFRNMLAVDPGFRAENVLVARVQLPWPAYDEARVHAFQDRLVTSARQVPGAAEVGLVSRVPFSAGNPQQNLYVEGREPPPGRDVPVVNQRAVSPGYFAAIGTPILRGRGIAETDRQDSPEIVVVDETVAQEYWPGGDALGKRIRTGLDTANHWMTIVGIVPNVKHQSLNERPNFEMYQPLAQSPRWGVYVVVRSRIEPEALVTTLRARVKEIDPMLPVFEVGTMEDAVSGSLTTARLTNYLLTGFAGLATLLAAIGIYGVMSLSVAARSSEFGVRLALGAEPGSVLRLVLRQGMVLALAGLALGLAGAVMVTRFLGTLLFGVGPTDPVTFVSVGATLAAAALLACYLPARRATKADPITVLRRE